MKSITTKRGDSGLTDLLGGVRVSKSHDIVMALGDIDELTSCLGLVRVHLSKETDGDHLDLIDRVQKSLIDGMGDVASLAAENQKSFRITPQHIEELETWAARYESTVIEETRWRGWALPGAAGIASSAYCDLARSVCRRAERSVYQAKIQTLPNAESDFYFSAYLNRLSDLLWILARELERGMQ